MGATTKEVLLEEAEKLIRTHGYAGFSYGDLSELVGIQKASIHYHFPTKELMGAALIDSYLERFEADLQSLLSTEAAAEERLRRYADFFAASLGGGLLPLCGALAAEKSLLPVTLCERLRYFFGLHLKWLETVISAGIEAKELREDLDPKASAQLVLSTMEGASLVTWATEDGNTIRGTMHQILRQLERARPEQASSTKTTSTT